MDSYLNNYDKFENIVIYDFKLYEGGIGDCIKFFMCLLISCIDNNKRLYYKKNNLEIEKYLKLIHEKMYITEELIQKLNGVEIIEPSMIYRSKKDLLNYMYNINIQDVFYFTDEVKINRDNLLPSNITNYISVHLRLGDKYLEIDERYIKCKDDQRNYSEEAICKYIEGNSDKNIFFCCDNRAYKLKLKEKFANIIITNCEIGHTTYSNTTPKQVLDALTELYILSNSDLIFRGSPSGFSLIASKFKNIPMIYAKIST